MSPSQRVEVVKELQWRNALGPRLRDHPWGSLCMDAMGHLYLIGDAMEGSDVDGGCGCCSNDIAEDEIISYAIVAQHAPEQGA